MTEVNFRDIPLPRYRKTNLPANRGTASRRAMFSRKSSVTGYVPTRVLVRYLKRCTPTCSALITGAHYKTVYVKGMWKMFMRIGAGSGLAFDSYKSEAKKVSVFHRMPASLPSPLLITIAPNSVTRSSVIREIGPEIEIAANGSRCSSKIHAARQRSPSACSSSSNE